MKRYCLKYKNSLWTSYIDDTKAGVKEQVWSSLGTSWAEFVKKNPRYSIVKVEIKEIA